MDLEWVQNSDAVGGLGLRREKRGWKMFCPLYDVFNGSPFDRLPEMEPDAAAGASLWRGLICV